MKQKVMASTASLGLAAVGTLAADRAAKPDVVGQHMAAQATLTAHFAAAALKVGMS